MGAAGAKYVGREEAPNEPFQVVAQTHSLLASKAILACGEGAALAASVALAWALIGTPNHVATILNAVATITYFAGLHILGIYPGRGMWGPVRIRFRALMAMSVFIPAAIANLLLPPADLGTCAASSLLFGGILFALSSFFEILTIHVADALGTWRTKVILSSPPVEATRITREFAIFPELGFELVDSFTKRSDADHTNTIHHPLFRGSDPHVRGDTTQPQLYYPIGYAPPLERSRYALIIARFIKRTTDIVGATIGLAFSLPLLAIATICIFFIDGRPILYAQPRGGLNKKKIRVWKFRSMYRNAQEKLDEILASDPLKKAEWNKHFKLRDDPRILPGIGKFLRQNSIDELPQLFNVLVGNMSLVGPRPFPENHLAVFSPEFRKLRASVVPGLSGLWQITLRSSGEIKDQEDLDRIYILNWSIWLDLYILLRTPFALLRRNGAM